MNMQALSAQLRRMAEVAPTAPHYNLNVLMYEVIPMLLFFITFILTYQPKL